MKKDVQRKKRFSIRDFLEMLYLDSDVPSYLYERGRLVHMQPKQSDLTFPPEIYLRTLFGNRESISCLSSAFGAYYGSIRLTGREDSLVVFGPVNLTPYSESEFHQMYMDYVVPGERHAEFRSFFQTIPQISLSAFLMKLCFVNYCLNQEKISYKEILPVMSEADRESAESTEQLYEKKNYALHNNSYEYESVLLDLIRTGNTEALKDMNFNDSHINAGITGPTSTRQLKNNIIIITTLSTRAAISGGLDPDTAFQLSDTFIQTAEHTSDLDTLNELLGKVCYTFAARVREIQTPVTSDSIIMQAIRYIQRNTGEHLTAADVAEHMGFSRSYFSSYFKQKLGFPVSDFIMRCKMEEAKQLLRYTNRPVSIISSYLCFSSQSHFQSAFKKLYGITPLQYRRDNSQNNDSPNKETE